MAVSRGLGIFLARRLSESSSRLGYVPRLRCLEFLSHDLWLDEQPSGFHHDPDSVPVCPYMFRMAVIGDKAMTQFEVFPGVARAKDLPRRSC